MFHACLGLARFLKPAGSWGFVALSAESFLSGGFWLQGSCSWAFVLLGGVCFVLGLRTRTLRVSSLGFGRWLSRGTCLCFPWLTSLLRSWKLGLTRPIWLPAFRPDRFLYILNSDKKTSMGFVCSSLIFSEPFLSNAIKVTLPSDATNDTLNKLPSKCALPGAEPIFSAVDPTLKP